MKEHLEAGGLVVYPTSTLPGLGCLPIAKGLDNLFYCKKRPTSMPVSLGVASMSQVENLVTIPEFVPNLLDSFPKGSLTLILPAIKEMDERLGGRFVAIRVFSHPEAIKLATNFGPITATSANESGSQSECNTAIAAKILGVEFFVDGFCPNEKGSTIIKLVNENSIWSLTNMREGVVPSADVMEWWTSQT